MPNTLLDLIRSKDSVTKQLLEKMLLSGVTTPKPVYTAQPIGVLDVNRIIRNESKCWRAPNEAKKPATLKHMVISDWSLLGVDVMTNFEKKRALLLGAADTTTVREKLATLVPEAGSEHRLFVWQGEKFLEIKTKLDLQKIDYAKITPASTEQIKNRLFEQHNISNEKILMLNPAKLRQVLGLLDNKKYYVNIQALLGKYTIEQLTEALKDCSGLKIEISAFEDTAEAKRLQQISPGCIFKLGVTISTGKLSSEVDDAQSPSRKIAQMLTSNLDGVNIDMDYSIGEFFTAQFIESNRALFNKTTQLRMQSNKLGYFIGESLSKLEDLHIYAPNEAETVAKFINQHPNLKNIRIGKGIEAAINVKNFTKSLDPSALLKLEEITIDLPCVNQEDLEFVLQHASKLKKITILRNDELFASANIPESMLNIEELRCESVSKNSESLPEGLNKLFNATPNIKKLTLLNCVINSGLWQNLESNLLKLEEVNLVGGSLSTKEVLTLLQKTPNIKKFYLDMDIGADINELQIFMPSLQQLEEIKLNGNISLGFLQQLIKLAPNLKKIDLYECSVSSVSITSLKTNDSLLAQLQEINLSECNVESSKVIAEWLLQQKSNTEVINKEHEDSFVSEMMFAKLEKAEINQEYDFFILKNSSNLKELKIPLKLTEKLKDVGEFQALKTIEVIELICSDDTDNNKNLLWWLQNAQHLKHINTEIVRNYKLNQELKRVIDEFNLIATNESLKNKAQIIQELQDIIENKNIPSNAISKKDSLSEMNESGKNLQKNEMTEALELQEKLTVFKSTIHANKSEFSVDRKGSKYGAIIDAESASAPQATTNVDQNKASLGKEGKEHEAIVGAEPNFAPRAFSELDSNVKYDSKELPYREIFYCPKTNFHLPPARIRLEVMFIDQNNIFTSKHADKDFFKHVSKPDHEIEFSTKDQFKTLREQGTSDLFHGVLHKIKIDANSYYPIPSICVKDKLMSIFIADPSVRGSIEIVYCKQSNLYYIHNKSETKITTDISFVVEAKMNDLPIELPNLEDIQEEELIKSLVLHCKGFDKPKDDKEYIIPEDNKFEAIYEAKVGSCRHRSKVLLWKIKQLQLKRQISAKVQARLIENDVHNYVEIDMRGDGNWVKVDLGGYGGDIKKISEPDREIEAQEQSTPIVESEDAQEQLKLQKTPTELEMTPSPEEFFDKIVKPASTAGSAQNILLQLPSDDIDNARLVLHELARETKRKIYYIDSPEDLACNIDVLELDDAIMTGDGLVATKIKAKGGPLNEFIKTCGKEAILVINWSNFPSDKFVSCHTVIDKERNIQGTLLPSDMLVVSLYPKDSDTCYKGNDFIERHGRQETNKYHSATLGELAEKIAQERHIVPQPVTTQQQDACIVELHESQDWQSYLIGQWIPTSTGTKFKPSPFIQAIKNGQKNIILHNAPWHLPDFKQFWECLVLDDGFYYHGGFLKVEGLNVTEDQEFNWSLYKNSIKTNSIQGENSHTYILNPSSFSTFLTDYQSKDGKLDQVPGILENCSRDSNGSLVIDLVVTKDISLGQWHELLQKAKAVDIKLCIRIAPGVVLPDELNKILAPQPCKLTVKAEKIAVYQCEPDDVDATVDGLMEKQTDTKIITISGCEYSDVLYFSKIEASGETYKFSQTMSSILELLTNKKNVLLRGHLSPILADCLASIILQGYVLHEGKKIQITGKLTIVSDSKNELKFCQDFVNIIPVKAVKPAQLVVEKPVESRINYTQAISLTDSKAATKSWYIARAKLLQDQLENQACPWVCIEGPTGCGKSTFINLHLAQTCTVFDGSNNIQAWAEHKPDQDKLCVLFIDEANLAGQDWLAFRDLTCTPPTILIDGKLIVLSANHRVVFASNPVTYGGRIEPELIKNYAKKIAFQPIPAEVLYQEVLLKLKPEAISDTDWQTICTAWLTKYQQANNTENGEPILTPRQLETMGILFNNTAGVLNEAHDYTQRAEAIFDQICGPYLANPGYKKSLTTLVAEPDEKTKKKIQEEHKLTYLESRHEAYAAFDSFLAIRQLKMQAKKENEQSALAKSTGLGGVLLNGSPGTGKSTFVVSVLKSKDFVEFNPTSKEDKPEDASKAFICLRSDYSVADKEYWLKEAYDKGYIVIMDELNTPLAEYLLNDLIGTKKAEGKAGHPGFMLFGTQNPSSMAGRETTSSAMKNRLLLIDFPDYSEEELLKIELDRKHLLQQEDLKVAIQIFINMQQEAKKSYKEPASYRLLETYLNQCDQIIVKLREKTEQILDAGEVNFPHKINFNKYRNPTSSELIIESNEKERKEGKNEAKAEITIKDFFDLYANAYRNGEKSRKGAMLNEITQVSTAFADDIELTEQDMDYIQTGLAELKIENIVTLIEEVHKSFEQGLVFMLPPQKKQEIKKIADKITNALCSNLALQAVNKPVEG